MIGPSTAFAAPALTVKVIAGGVVVLAEQFSHDIYRKSLARLFEVDEHGHLQMYFNATLEVIVSKVGSLLFVVCHLC